MNVNIAYVVEQVTKGIKGVKFLGIVLSPNSVRSDFVKKGLVMAEMRELKHGKIRMYQAGRSINSLPSQILER